MSKTLSNLLLDGYIDLGLAEEPFLATGGSTTTIVNSAYADLTDPPLTDFSKRYTAFVEFDAGGAAAAPQGEYAKISAYNESTWTHTMAALTTAVASGDRIVIASDLVPLQQMIVLANDVVQDYGRLELVDTSLTTASNQTEYTLPVGITRENLYDVKIQGTTSDANANEWYSIPFSVIPAVAGTAHTLVTSQYATGYKYMLYYRDFHARLSVFSSTISPTLQYPLIKSAFRYKITDWYNQRNEGGDPFWLSAEKKSAGLLDVAKVEFPHRPPQIRNKTINLKHGSTTVDTVPDPIS